MILYRIVDYIKDKIVRLVPTEIKEIITFLDQNGEINLCFKVVSFLELGSRICYFVTPTTEEYLQNNIYKEEGLFMMYDNYFTLNEQLAISKFQELLRKYEEG